MDYVQEVGGIDWMMAHQAEQGGAVSLRITGAQPVGFVHIHAQPVDDVLRHPAIDRGENRVRRVVQRVVEIE